MSEHRVTLREGARILLRGIRTEPWVFSFSLLGSVAFAVITVASAGVVGRVT